MSDVIAELAKEAIDKAMEVARLKAENDRLREERDTYRDLVGMMDHPDVNAKLREELDAAKHDLSIFSGRIVELDAENAKLRDLAAGIGHLLFPLDVDYCAGCPRDDINHPCPVYTVDGGECLYKTDLRELGVEVDG